MMPAAKHFDPVLGIDLHLIVGAGPYPVPHPFIGMILDPFDYLPLFGATVMINSVPRAQAGTGGIATPPHIPIGGVFAKPPANECEMFMGSSTVQIDGEAASHLALPVLSCHDVGVLAPPRVKKKGKIRSFVMPTSVVLPIPTGPPVLIGGPPTISLFALGARVAMAGLVHGFRKLKALRKERKLGRALSGYGPGGAAIPIRRPANVHKTLTAVPVSLEDLQKATKLVDGLLGKGRLKLDPARSQAWREAVYRDLLTIGSTDTGRRVLREIDKSGKQVRIGSLDNFNLNRAPKDRIGPMCIYDAADPTKTAGDSLILYEPNRLYGNGTDSPSDVVLLHELDHGQRAAHGANLDHEFQKGTQEHADWKDTEEKVAVWTENAYRRERGGVRQRRNYADLP